MHKEYLVMWQQTFTAIACHLGLSKQKGNEQLQQTKPELRVLCTFRRFSAYCYFWKWWWVANFGQRWALYSECQKWEVYELQVISTSKTPFPFAFKFEQIKAVIKDSELLWWRFLTTETVIFRHKEYNLQTGPTFPWEGRGGDEGNGEPDHKLQGICNSRLDVFLHKLINFTQILECHFHKDNFQTSIPSLQ